MSRVAASLAAAALALGLSACDGDGAEPGASREATLVLDFVPNAVHAGIYAAEAEGYYADEGIDLEIREPGASTDAPKLLEAGRADFAVMDIHDVGLAVESGFELRVVAPIIERPLASVIATEEIGRPRELEGGTVGVTGLPSDDAVLDAVLEADGADAAAVERVTIGFDSVAALSAGRVDAATAFWNAEGVALARRGVATNEFRVDDFGAPRYPELVVVAADTSAPTAAMKSATAAGSQLANSDPGQALDHLLDANPGLDRDEQQAQLDALLAVDAFGDGELDPESLREWGRWDAAHGLLEDPPSVEDLTAG